MSSAAQESEPEAGDAEKSDRPTEEMVTTIYQELHRLAERRMSEQNPGHTLQATALVNEAFLKLFGAHPPRFNDRDHFLASAARAMRSVLIDHARRKNRTKRKATFEEVPLESLTGNFAERAQDLLALDEALSRLARFDSDLAHIVELRFFGGLELKEIARIMEVSRRKAERDFQLAREWLRNDMR